MKAGFFDPYLDTLGGGERYCLTLANYLIKNGWSVDFFWNGKNFSTQIKKRFGIDLKKINFVSEPNGIWQKIRTHSQYDLLFFISDGSIPLMLGRKNLLHLQVPFQKVNGDAFSNKIKFLLIKKVICNSQFTKKFIDEEFKIKSAVVYPPVRLAGNSLVKKENLIISVARFSQLLQAKKQDVLVKVFKEMCDEGLEGWRLVFVGGSDVGAIGFLTELRKSIDGYPIEIKENIDYSELTKLYSKSKIFWSASGFGIDENEDPEKVEHFGITAVEAMAAGDIPILINKGGFKEIVEEGKNGFFWETESELKRKTLLIINLGAKFSKISQEAAKRSKIFSEEKFYEEIKKLVF